MNISQIVRRVFWMINYIQNYLEKYRFEETIIISTDTFMSGTVAALGDTETGSTCFFKRYLFTGKDNVTTVLKSYKIKQIDVNSILKLSKHHNEESFVINYLLLKLVTK